MYTYAGYPGFSGKTIIKISKCYSRMFRYLSSKSAQYFLVYSLQTTKKIKIQILSHYNISMEVMDRKGENKKINN